MEIWPFALVFLFGWGIALLKTNGLAKTSGKSFWYALAASLLLGILSAIVSIGIVFLVLGGMSGFSFDAGPALAVLNWFGKFQLGKDILGLFF